jgi:hypothetical protein
MNAEEILRNDMHVSTDWIVYIENVNSPGYRQVYRCMAKDKDEPEEILSIAQFMWERGDVLGNRDRNDMNFRWLVVEEECVIRHNRVAKRVWTGGAPL